MMVVFLVQVLQEKLLSKWKSNNYLKYFKAFHENEGLFYVVKYEVYSVFHANGFTKFNFIASFRIIVRNLFGFLQ